VIFRTSSGEVLAKCDEGQNGPFVLSVVNMYSRYPSVLLKVGLHNSLEN